MHLYAELILLSLNQQSKENYFWENCLRKFRVLDWVMSFLFCLDKIRHLLVWTNSHDLGVNGNGANNTKREMCYTLPVNQFRQMLINVLGYLQLLCSNTVDCVILFSLHTQSLGCSSCKSVQNLPRSDLSRSRQEPKWFHQAHRTERVCPS